MKQDPMEMERTSLTAPSASAPRSKFLIPGIVVLVIGAAATIAGITTSVLAGDCGGACGRTPVPINTKFVDITGTGSRRRLQPQLQTSRKLNCASPTDSCEVVGGAAAELDIQHYKMAVSRIALCTDLPADGLPSSYYGIDNGIPNCDYIVGTDGSAAGWNIGWKENSSWESYLKSIPPEAWVDLADREAMEKFEIPATLYNDTTYTWGFVEWYQAADITASIPMLDKDGALTGETLYTKSNSIIDMKFDQAIDFHPTILPVDTDMTVGPAAAMPVMLDGDDLFYSFELGAATTLAAGADESYELDFSYTLDRGTLVGFLHQAWDTPKNPWGAGCKRIESDTNIECGQSMGNVLSLHDNGANMEARVPPVLPLIYKNDTEAVVRQTYMVEMDASLPGNQETFSFSPLTPWNIRVDTFYIVPISRSNEEPILLTSADRITAAYFTLEDYFEVQDYLGTLIDFAQIGRILYLDGYNDGGPILSSQTAHFSIFDDFTPVYVAGEKQDITIYSVSGGNAVHRCKCDLERPLLEFLIANHKSVYDNDYGDFEKQLSISCNVYIPDEGEDMFSAAKRTGDYVADLVEKRACMESDESSNCCGAYHIKEPDFHALPTGLDFWDVYDECKCTLEHGYDVGDYDDSCWRKAEFGLDGCGSLTKGTDAYDDAVSSYATQPAAVAVETCDLVNDCSGGKGYSCKRDNFGSAGGGCSPGSNTQRDFREKAVIELVETSKV